MLGLTLSTFLLYARSAPDSFTTLTLSLRWRLISNLSMRLTLPYRYNQGEYVASDTMEVKLYGLSDMLLEGRWRYALITEEVGVGVVRRLQLGAIAGLRIGSGKCDQRDENGELVPVRYQLGVGTTNPYLGIELRWRPKLAQTLLLLLQYQFNSENKAGYERGDNLTAKLSYGFTGSRFHIGGGPLILSVLQHDRQNGVIVANTRGEFIYLEAEMSYRLTSAVNLTYYARYLLSSASAESENALRWQTGVGFMVSF
ncbi:MAG: hypothetical protein DRP63_03315 [Planctomycetota bacterium]|nr:MAG: hypothetical protein DRP63_03315 [Planctomycetota bacterium]